MSVKRMVPMPSAKERETGASAPAVLLLTVLGLFKKVFKKKVKKKEPEDEDDKGGGLTKKDLEDWANLQRLLKEKEGKAQPQAVESAPEREGPSGPSGGPKGFGDAKQGYNYLFEEIRPKNAYICFFRMLAGGDQGLCITSTYPKKIRDLYSKDYPALKELPIFWLSDWYGASQEFLNIGQEERTLRPARLDFEIMKEISNFIKKNRGKGVLIIDGIEALILANSFEKVISFLTTLNNMASANMCSIIAPINPGVFKRRDRFILQKIFDDVRTFVDDDISTDED